MATASPKHRAVTDTWDPGASERGARGFRRRRRFLLECSVAAEALLLAVDLLIGLGLRSLFDPSSPTNHTTVLVGCVLAGLTLAVSLLLRGVVGQIAAPELAATAVAVASTVVFAGLFVLRSIGNGTSRPLVVLVAALALITLTLGHYLARHWLARFEQAQPRYIAVVGGPEATAELMGFLSAGSGWSVIASLSDEIADQGELRAALDEFQEILRTRPVDEVLLAARAAVGGPLAAEVYRGVTEMCELAGVRLHVMAGWLSAYRDVTIDHLGGRPVLTFSFCRNSPWLLLTKRLIDIFVSGVLLILLAPVFLLLAVIVRFDSPGPVFFRQVRCGLRGRPFTIYKFRSMVPDAEALRSGLEAQNELTGPVFKIARDPRITRVGRWLRRSSLDELPQLWNVLVGQMSLVGPRPPTPDEVAQYPLGSLQRLSMKPGVTGLWQVSGRNGLRDFSRWVELDAEYIRRWSLLLDFKILLRTVAVVARMTGV